MAFDSIGFLLAILVLLLVVSGFFSAAETSMMALNRYRLRHLVRARHRGAKRADELLRRPDRLIGLVLLGNNFANILASSIATLIALRVWGEDAIAPAAALLTVLVLLFSEVTPKTLAALRPERVAFPAAYVLGPLMWVMAPMVWALNAVSNGLLRLCGIRHNSADTDRLSREELRTVLYEGAAHFTPKHRSLLLRILDLETVTVRDVMAPRSEIEGLDLDEDAVHLLERILTIGHTRLPVYRTSLEHTVGILHVRRVAHLLGDADRLVAELPRFLQEPYYVPERTPLTQQLRQFEAQRQRMALVVDEYGDTLGLVTVEDIVREMVGELSDQGTRAAMDVRPQADGSYLVDGGTSLRELERRMGWALATDGARTLNGAILEYLQDIPTPGTSVLLSGYPVEIVQATGNAVRLARVHPRIARQHG